MYENAARDRVLDTDALAGIQITQRHEHDKTDGALINPASFSILKRQRRQRGCFSDLIVQFQQTGFGSGSQHAPDLKTSCGESITDKASFRKFNGNIGYSKTHS